MKTDADACDNQFDGRMAMNTGFKSFWTSKKTRADQSGGTTGIVTLVCGRADTNHFLRFPFGFFFATVSAAGTVCSGSEKSLTRASSSWILCIVCEILAMIRDF